MTIPRSAVSDERRLAAVLRTRLLDSEPEAPFDDLARLAAEVLAAPYALITVVDDQRSYWKACFGRRFDSLEARQNTVEESFCQYVIDKPEPLLVDDTRRNATTQGNPSIESMGVLAWAGVPLRAPGGEVLGSFCVIDTKPRAWSPRDGEVLSTLAKAASAEIALRDELRTATLYGERLSGLYALSGRLTETATVDSAAELCLAEGRRAVGASGGSLRLLDDDGRSLRLVRASGGSARFVGAIGTSIAVDGDLACAQVCRTGRPVIVTRREEIAERLPETLPRLEQTTVHAFAALPLVGHGGEVIGVFALSFSEPRTLADAEVTFLETLGRLCTQTIERVRLLTAERAVRADIERLLTVTSGLVRALTVHDVAGVAVPLTMEALGARGGALVVPGRDGVRLGNVALYGYDTSGGDEWRESLSLVATECLRTGNALMLGSKAEILERFPTLETPVERSGDHAWAALPLLRAGRKLGALFVSFSAPREFATRERRFLSNIADQTWSALERVRLYARTADTEAEAAWVNGVSARIDAERSLEGRARVLAEALVEDLADSVEVEFTQEGAARIIARARRTQAPGAGSRGSGAGGSARIAIPYAGEPHGRILLALPAGVIRLASGQWAALERLALHVGLAFRNAILYDQEHRIAQTLQRSLLPRQLPDLDRMDIAGLYVPAGEINEVGGDFYDLFVTGRSVFAIVGDVCGKGPEAAALTALCRHTIRAAARDDEHAAPSRIVHLLGRALHENTATSEYCTVSVVRLREAAPGLELQFCVAGHPAPALVRGNGRIEELTSPGGLVGLDPTARFGDGLALMRPGDSLVLYTDGITESRRGSVFFGEDRLRRLLSGLAGRSAKDVVATLDREVVRFEMGGRRRDDIAVLALRVIAASDRHFHRTLTTDPGDLAPFRRALRQWLREMHVPDENAQDIVLAGTEACSNSMEHGYRFGKGTIRVTGDYDAGGDVRLSVSDRGSWRDTPAAGNRGRGLALIHATMDDIDVRHEDTGTCVTMRKAARKRSP